MNSQRNTQAISSNQSRSFDSRAHVLLGLLAGLTLVALDSKGQVQWVERPIPSGIVYHPDFGVTVHHDQVGFFPAQETEGLTAYSPTIPPVRVGHLTWTGRVTSGTRMAYEPVTGLVFELVGGGALNVFNQGTGALVGLGNVRLTAWDFSEVFDVAINAERPQFNGQIIPNLSTFGDLAVQNANGSFNLHLSGISQTFPFVLRLRFSNTDLAFQEAKVVAASTASTAPFYSEPRGVAVRSDGLVVTTLPLNFGQVNHDVLFTFPGDYDPDTSSPPVARLNNRGIYSKGMTTDDHNQVYIATGEIGDPFASGTIIVVNPALDDFVGLSVGTSIIQNSVDVAALPNGSVVFVSMANNPVLNNWSGIVWVNSGDLVPPSILETQVTPTNLNSAGGSVGLTVFGGDFRGVVQAQAVITKPDQVTLLRDLALTTGTSTAAYWSGTYAVAPNGTSSNQNYSVVFRLKDALGNIANSPPSLISVSGAGSLRITSMKVTGNQVQLQWSGGEGPFQIQQRDNPAAGIWTVIASNIVGGSISFMRPTNSWMFFRLVD